MKKRSNRSYNLFLLMYVSPALENQKKIPTWSTFIIIIMRLLTITIENKIVTNSLAFITYKRRTPSEKEAKKWTEEKETLNDQSHETQPFYWLIGQMLIDFLFQFMKKNVYYHLVYRIDMSCKKRYSSGENYITFLFSIRHFCVFQKTVSLMCMSSPMQYACACYFRNTELKQ